ncbi:Uma2 family endonuclease [Gemmata sp.]|uniref:Uma2 family endonuclease n=1 Tax=Gemmata sp. TaxID=1914242 RepID=UPI003F6F8520
MTPAQSPPTSPSPLYAAAGFFRLTVDQYHEMIRNNTLTTDDRVELLDGYLVNKLPQNTPHGSTVDRLTEDLNRVKPTGWRVRAQLPVTLSNSEPEPDAVLVRGYRRTYDLRHPTGTDFGILVEVADSSLALDRGPKANLYTRAGIPVYWIVNIPDRRVEVYTDPDPAANPPVYRTRTDYGTGDAVPVVLDGVAVATLPVADLIPVTAL